MTHLLHMALLAALVGTFFALLTAEEGRRLKRGLIIGGSLFGGGVLLGLVMAPFS